MRGETYFVTGGELDDQEFFKDNSVVEGAGFASLKNQSVLYHFR
ncbi:hypothetical protein MOE00_08830 [Bacillus inaquosorum]|nr:hypothetical protein [Bacillus inaquosorum]MCY7767108.1 hypothetical protein [Bacillus inaquosorum]MCY8053336.1 hypothetical protein [Bacillus inaquosorum]MCY8694465.1 hypothetical protein [Bacillus inaquosorum]MCY8724262.1 hypothetical protein [Bacillus inaquosorum]MCY8792419.1 hypothetical protein [Bacillus inaquosorum]